MATLIVKDLDTHHELDFRPMSCISAAALPWVFGWIKPAWPPALARLHHRREPPREINYSFYADQMNNQFQNIDDQNKARQFDHYRGRRAGRPERRSVDLSPARWPGSTPAGRRFDAAPGAALARSRFHPRRSTP